MNKQRKGIIALVCCVLLLALIFLILFRRFYPPVPKIPFPDPQIGQSAVTSEEEEFPNGNNIIISELMCKNTAALADRSGSFSAWIELVNSSDHTVDMDGWSLRNARETVSFPHVVLDPGAYLLVYSGAESFEYDEMHLPISLKTGDTLELIDDEGQLRDCFTCVDALPNYSVVRNEDGGYCSTPWVTPGAENTTVSYDLIQRQTVIPNGLTISEVMSANADITVPGERGADWIELRNCSDRPLNLRQFYLSDDLKELRKCQLPDLELAPGAICLFASCDADAYHGESSFVNFSLKRNREAVYLSDDSGLVDWLPLRELSVHRSIGRITGENGIFYFSEPTPGIENSTDGKRRVSAPPSTGTPRGVYHDIEALDLVLHGTGTIAYTTDGSKPTEHSEIYTAPLSLKHTCVIRAVQFSADEAPSDPVTLSYIINEGHTLPVLSLAVDDAQLFNFIYFSNDKSIEFSANISYFDGNEGFCEDCGVHLAGNKSLETQLKKSLLINFSSKYGIDTLQYDIFHQGVGSYHSLKIRAGQDFRSTLFRDDLWQSLADDADAKLLTQDSQFAVLYINGQYYGLFSLKEDLSRQYYAEKSGAPLSSVESCKLPAPEGSSFYEEVYAPFSDCEFTRREEYDRFCELVDIDSLIDWIIFEGVSGNLDLYGNVRMFRSTQPGGKWVFAFFDLDFSMHPDIEFGYVSFDAVFIGTSYGTHQLSMICQNLMHCPEFKNALIQRYADLYHGVLSNEAILSKVSYYSELLSPEIDRDEERWFSSREKWENAVTQMRALLTDIDWMRMCSNCLSGYLGMDSDELIAMLEERY